MLSTSARLAAKFAHALAVSGIKQTTVALACDVSKQAVQGWLKTGRIDKKHLPKLAALTGFDLAWWLDGEGSAGDTQIKTITDTFDDWRFKASPRSVAVIDMLTAAAKRNALKEEDWLLIEQLAQRFAKRP